MSSMSLSYLNSRWLGLGSSRRGVRPCASVQAATKARVELQAATLASAGRCNTAIEARRGREGARTSQRACWAVAGGRGGLQHAIWADFVE